MAPDDSKEVIKITLDDLATIAVPGTGAEPVAPATPSNRSYGTIVDAAEKAPMITEERGSILLRGWFYLGTAGLLGATIGWAICEPGFVDGAGRHRWGNFWLVPVMLALMCIAFGVAESIVERSPRKALIRGLLSLPLGIMLGFVFYFLANIIFNIGLEACVSLGAQTYRNPAFWIARGLAWMVFGTAGGIVYGIVGQSGKKAKYGIFGGMIGAAIGGVIFDPISILTGGAAPSRAVGFALVGLATGVGMGLVESALKDRWLYVTAGPLAGKQFILYKSQTTIGSEQRSDIYLFKDSSILPQHALILVSGARVHLRAMGAVYVAGNPIQSRVLQDSDLLQIGRYAFRYKEKHRP